VEIQPRSLVRISAITRVHLFLPLDVNAASSEAIIRSTEKPSLSLFLCVYPCACDDIFVLPIKYIYSSIAISVSWR